MVRQLNVPWIKSKKERDEIVAEYRALIKTDEDKKTFEDTYNNIRSIYRYAEDHLSGLSIGFIRIWYAKVREFGQLLVNCDMLDEVDDIFMVNRYEIPELLTEVSTGWALGVDIPMRSEPLQGHGRKTQENP
jgi:pyruvate,water dikinase